MAEKVMETQGTTFTLGVDHFIYGWGGGGGGTVPFKKRYSGPGRRKNISPGKKGQTW